MLSHDDACWKSTAPTQHGLPPNHGPSVSRARTTEPDSASSLSWARVGSVRSHRSLALKRLCQLCHYEERPSRPVDAWGEGNIGNCRSDSRLQRLLGQPLLGCPHPPSCLWKADLMSQNPSRQISDSETRLALRTDSSDSPQSGSLPGTRHGNDLVAIVPLVSSIRGPSHGCGLFLKPLFRATTVKQALREDCYILKGEPWVESGGLGLDPGANDNVTLAQGSES
jgi:hypothetical protein